MLHKSWKFWIQISLNLEVRTDFWRLRTRPGELWTPLGPPYGPGARGTPTFWSSWAPFQRFWGPNWGPRIAKNQHKLCSKSGPIFGSLSEPAGKGYEEILSRKRSPFWRPKLVPGRSRRGLRCENAENAETTIFVIYYGLGGLPKSLHFP